MGDLDSPDSATRPLHVLVAEDAMFNRDFAQALLRRLGHTFDTADNGLDAFFLAAQVHFDAILMDGSMPVLDGFEATRKIRLELPAGAPTSREVRIIAVTAHGATGDREECLAAGMDGYLTKPLQLDSLALELSFAAAPGTSRGSGTPPSRC
jgi:CheY-like chemotaxis protein